MLTRRLAALLCLAACGTDDPPGGDGSETSPPTETTPIDDTGSPPVDTGHPSTGTPFVPVDCSPLCGQNGTDAGWARCYSCRCKNAMDGWLPSPAEMQCSLGDEIVVSTVDADGVLTPIDHEVSTCANPSLLYGTCDPGGRLGQLTHGDVTVKWICRRNSYHDNAADPTIPYNDVGAILYNERNGMSCWYDDMDNTGLAGDNWPDIDLTAPDADPTEYLHYFYAADGVSCTSCHDNDPFNLTPYLRAIPWVTGTYTFGAFGLVDVNGGAFQVTQRSLVSPEVTPCLACHRITSNATCDDWAPDALGVDKGAGYQQLVENVSGDPADPLWALGTWMPYGVPLGTAAEWEAIYGAARDTIVDCCRNPGVNGPGCTWEALPPAGG
jgi:hypothetical protein